MAAAPEQRIACLTYHKYPSEDWPQEEFVPAQVRLPSDEIVIMDLAECGTCRSNGSWIRELRKHSERGHQTANLCPDYHSAAAPLAMFARWSQENEKLKGASRRDLTATAVSLATPKSSFWMHRDAFCPAIVVHCNTLIPAAKIRIGTPFGLSSKMFRLRRRTFGYVTH